jgi:hypothetical protein
MHVLLGGTQKLKKLPRGSSILIKGRHSRRGEAAGDGRGSTNPKLRGSPQAGEWEGIF